MAGSANNIFYSVTPPGTAGQAATFGRIMNPLLNANSTPGVASPAVAGGATLSLAGMNVSLADRNGTVRPIPGAVGAYEPIFTCDLNGDGVVDLMDVGIAVNSGNVQLIGRVVLATLGKPCE
jgi:hypothetical protein